MGHQLSATRRGLGAPHQRLRKALLPYAYGCDCPLCGLPMVPGQPLDLDHVVPRALGGRGGPVRMTHAKCNRSAGTRLGNRLRRQVSRW